MRYKLIINNIAVPVGVSEPELFEIADKRLRGAVHGFRTVGMNVYRRSVDARKRNDIQLVYSVLAELELAKLPTEQQLKRANLSIYSDEIPTPVPGSVTLDGRPVIVGFGPCGMFCALLLAEYGYKPVVIERGSEVFRRTEKVEKFYRSRELDPESNIQFGAGGAGTFSDGKLVTRINDPKCRYVLSRFCEFGAPEAVMTAAKPHVGTDLLRTVVSNLSKRIEELGGEVLYDTRLDGIAYHGSAASSIMTPRGEIDCGLLVIAVGHSARDTYAMLSAQNFIMIPKPFSVGVRIEHLTEDIDRAMFGDFAGDPRLGHAEYNLSAHFGDTGVYTFCMCPGGEVVAAASEAGGVVVNGMSRHARDGRNSNSAVAVSVAPENPIEFQRRLEAAAFAAGGGRYSAPIQTVGGFLECNALHEPKRVIPTYMDSAADAVRLADLNELLPSEVAEKLKLGLRDFDRKISGFAAGDAVLTGLETRTSAPIRIIRDADGLAQGFSNIYPCGEGAGYAGGITSAAVDGINCAVKIIEKYRQPE